MKYYTSALWKILASWYIYIALFLDLLGILLTFYSGIKGVISHLRKYIGNRFPFIVCDDTCRTTAQRWIIQVRE